MKPPLIVLATQRLDEIGSIGPFLHQNGFEVVVFNDEKLAIQAANQNVKDWRAVITGFLDCRPNETNLLTTLNLLSPQLPLFLTGAPTHLNAKITGYFQKPFHLPQILSSLQESLQTPPSTKKSLEPPPSPKSPDALMGKIIAKSIAFKKTLDLAKRVAPCSANVFISGESGTGKELIARYIHSEGNQKNGPFVAINCSAIPENLLESELFGHGKGAFTGAQDVKKGLFEEAENGTLMLDEIGDMSLPLQSKLLRVLQEKEIRRVGENTSRPINCRIISATHKDLSIEVKENRFREDLFYRLDVIPIYIPPLRHRVEDILPMAEFFLEKFSRPTNAPPKSLSQSAKDFLIHNSWPGNVRELENAIERASVLATGPVIEIEDFFTEDLSKSVSQQPKNLESFCVDCSEELEPLESVVKSYIEFAVSKMGGVQDHAARKLGIDRKTLSKRIKSQDKEDLD